SPDTPAPLLLPRVFRYCGGFPAPRGRDTGKCPMQWTPARCRLETGRKYPVSSRDRYIPLAGQPPGPDRRVSPDGAGGTSDEHLRPWNRFDGPDPGPVRTAFPGNPQPASAAWISQYSTRRSSG